MFNEESLDKLDRFYLVSSQTAECLRCDANITSEHLGDLGSIVGLCLDHQCDKSCIDPNYTGP